MSRPAYVRRAKKRWKTIRRLTERFYKEHGRGMTFEEAQKIFNGGR